MLSDGWKTNLSVGVSATGSLRPTLQPRILIVSPSQDESQVLATVLARDGITIWTERNAEDGLQTALAEKPDVIVLDEDVLVAQSLAIEFSAVAENVGSQLIILGDLPTAPGRFSDWNEVSKPYHFDTLIRKIETVLRIRCAA